MLLLAFAVMFRYVLLVCFVTLCYVFVTFMLRGVLLCLRYGVFNVVVVLRWLCYAYAMIILRLASYAPLL